MAQKDKIELRRTTWFVVNIKARKNQKPSHYVGKRPKTDLVI